ncbi:hypothetical protein [Shinella zoogloeoides]|uniref:hypothetical protein n=1 Tax=Shinella zoogloeoides TaxID=352475 RepID=UPI0013C3482C|nr:hypothetical protein [Shinella zoogloeoides]
MAPRIFGNVVRAECAVIRVTAEEAMAHMQEKMKKAQGAEAEAFNKKLENPLSLLPYKQTCRTMTAWER